MQIENSLGVIYCDKDNGSPIKTHGYLSLRDVSDYNPYKPFPIRGYIAYGNPESVKTFPDSLFIITWLIFQPICFQPVEVLV